MPYKDIEKRRENKRKYRLNNLEKIKEYQKNWMRIYTRKNKDKINQSKRVRYHQNKEESRKYIRESYWKHHEKRIKYGREYYIKNRLRLLESAKRYREKNKSLLKLKSKEYRGTINGKKIRSQLQIIRHHKNKSSGIFTRKEWLKIIEKFKGKCASCRLFFGEKLTIDHIIPLSKGGKNIKENIQPLCLYCNLKKGTKTINYTNTSD